MLDRGYASELPRIHLLRLSEKCHVQCADCHRKLPGAIKSAQEPASAVAYREDFRPPRDFSDSLRRGVLGSSLIMFLNKAPGVSTRGSYRRYSVVATSPDASNHLR